MQNTYVRVYFLLYPNLGGLGWLLVRDFPSRVAARAFVDGRVKEGAERRRYKVEV